ncbi:MAG: hypothetical protein ACOYD1_13165 [Candidatus Nanopelagicales bacterium]
MSDTSTNTPEPAPFDLRELRAMLRGPMQQPEGPNPGAQPQPPADEVGQSVRDLIRAAMKRRYSNTKNEASS